MRKGSPACKVRAGCPWIIICTVPVRMYGAQGLLLNSALKMPAFRSAAAPD
jgi:hypothetical protein